MNINSSETIEQQIPHPQAHQEPSLQQSAGLFTLALALILIAPFASLGQTPANLPTFQQLKSFGTPSLANDVRAKLIQGADGALYGTANHGGTHGYGTVFKLDLDGTALNVLQNFDYYTTGGYPEAGLVQGPDGALYGTTTGGGTGYGTVFKINPDGTGFIVLKNFDYYTTGGGLFAELMLSSNGALYGTTQYGGIRGSGTVFKLNPDGTGFAVLKSFDNSSTGGYPSAGLLEGADGALYGAAYHGGAYGFGTLFKLNADGSGFVVLKSFDNVATGRNPRASLIEGADGALYGTTQSGGRSSYGTAFKLYPDGTGFTVLQNFDYYTTGRYLYGGLIQGADGALYGTALEGGTGEGTVFRLNPDGTGFIILKNLGSSLTGAAPYAGLVQGADGALYGTTRWGGGANGGTVFKLNPDGSAFVVIRKLSANADLSVTGGNVWAGLVQGADGALYGTAFEGGSSGYGTIFKLNPGGTGFTVLKNLVLASGAHAQGTLIQGTDGMLYGTAVQGGTRGYGGVFKMAVDGTGFTLLKSFDYFTTGAWSYAGLLQGQDGALYGTTSQGGSPGHGTVFKLNPDGTGFAILKNFDVSTTGGYPRARLLQANDGALYGTTLQGGSSFYGTVFKLNPDGTGFTVLKNFDYYTTGGSPQAGLIQGIDGALYGPASYGGEYGNGTVFKLNPDGSGFAILKNFASSTTGGRLLGSLIQGVNGNLYGVASEGGNRGYGSVFQLNPDGTGFAVLKNLDTASGSYPTAGLMEAADGALYGTTTQGGNANGGTIFRVILPPPNTLPVAQCRNKNVTLSLGEGCTADASIDDGSFDPDSGDTITVTQTPAGPYPLGSTDVTLTVTDNHGASASCSATVTVIGTMSELAALQPSSANANSPGFLLSVTGSCFASESIVHWNGSPRPTTFVNDTELAAEIFLNDLTTTADLMLVNVTVVSPGGTSAPKLFTITNPAIGDVQSGVAQAGGTTTVSTAPTTPGEAGVSASVSNLDGSPVLVSAATYADAPPSGLVFDAGGTYYDIQVTGADASDSLEARFYYPSTVTGSAENSLKLTYFNGTTWIPVRGSKNAAPTKNADDDLDGTFSGGRFTVVLDNSSSPKLTALTGTVFALADTAPIITSLIGPTAPLTLGATATVTVGFLAVGTPSSERVVFNWGDGNSSTIIPVTTGAVSASHVYPSAGVYKLLVTVLDSNDDSAPAQLEYIVVYDPNGAFVTGGGWIWSPAGAYVNDAGLEGKASFGFVARYKRGATVPDGNTEFQFKAGGLNFKSASYEWLVVSGARAQFKGQGTINGQGDFGFILTAIDGAVQGGGGLDRFRIKIWDRATGGLVYDNQAGTVDNVELSPSTQLGGGSIIIHK